MLFRSTWRKKALAIASLTAVLFSLIPSAVLASPPEMTLSVSPTTINPSEGEKAYFNWNLISSNAFIEIYIYDKDPLAGGNIVRTVKSLTQYSSGAPAVKPTWDGKIIKEVGQNNVLIYGPSGSYTYLVRAWKGLETKVFKGTITLDYDNDVVQPIIGTVKGNDNNDYVKVNPFDPKQGQQAEILYHLNIFPTSLTFEIWDGNTKIATIANPPKKDGWNQVEWSGLKANGTPYEEKTYTYSIKAINSAGNQTYTDSETGTVTIDYASGGDPQITTPQITSDDANPDPFDPDNTSTTISYNLNVAVDNATVQILDGNNVVETLTNAGKAQGPNTAVWDGLKSNGQRFEEKTYNYQISVVKYIGNQTYTDSEMGTVRIEYDDDDDDDNNTTAPQISNVHANPDPFDPSEVYLNGYGTRLYFTLSKAGYVTIHIYDSSSNPIKTVMSGAYRSAGVNYGHWSGQDASGNDFEDGTYTFEVEACSTVDFNICNTQTGTVRIDGNGVDDDDDDNGTGNLVSNVTVDNNVFDPEDGEEAELCFDVEEDNVDISVKIVKNSTTVVELKDEADYDEGDDQCISWDGEDDDGDIVNDGSYLFYLLAEKAGEDDDVITRSVTVDTDGGGTTDGDFINNIELENEVFDPEENEEAEICFDIEEDNVDIRIDILDDDNDVVTTLTNKQYDEENNRCISWDGEDDDNDIVDDGDYRFRIKASKGGETQTEYENIEVDTDGTSANGTLLRNFEVTRRTFDPEDGERVQICFDIEKDNTDLLVEVLDDDNDRVRKLLDNEYDETENFCVTWNGKDDDNDIVTDDSYKIRLEAERGTESQTTTTNVTVDTNGGGNGDDDCDFIDLPSSSKYYDAFQWACEENIFNGYEDDYMRPSQKINRYETAKVILAYNNIEPLNNDGSNAGYSDVEKGHWAVGWLRAARQYGIHGHPDGTFRGLTTINLVELTRMAVELAEIDIPHCNYSPYNKNVWWNDYLCFVRENDISNAEAAAPMSRGDVALMLYELDRLGY